MKRIFNVAPGALMLGAMIALASYLPAHAKEDKVLARVGDVAIHQSELALAEAEVGAELASIPEDKRKAVLLRYLIDTQLLANAAKDTKLDQEPIFKMRAKYYQRRALRDTYFERNVRNAVTDAEAKKVYDEHFGKAKPQEEVRARHILVDSEDDAKEIVEQLARGDEFADLAKEKSKGPSKTRGGDLGYFTKGRMVKEFETAAFALEKGEVSEPVKSKFGWHVIKVEDKRMKPQPSFESLKDRIKSQLIQQKSEETLEKLRKDSKVEVPESDVSKVLKELE